MFLMTHDCCTIVNAAITAVTCISVVSAENVVALIIIIITTTILLLEIVVFF